MENIDNTFTKPIDQFTRYLLLEIINKKEIDSMTDLLLTRRSPGVVEERADISDKLKWKENKKLRAGVGPNHLEQIARLCSVLTNSSANCTMVKSCPKSSVS